MSNNIQKGGRSATGHPAAAEPARRTCASTCASTCATTGTPWATQGRQTGKPRPHRAGGGPALSRARHRRPEHRRPDAGSRAHARRLLQAFRFARRAGEGSARLRAVSVGPGGHGRRRLPPARRGLSQPGAPRRAGQRLRGGGTGRRCRTRRRCGTRPLRAATAPVARDARRTARRHGGSGRAQAEVRAMVAFSAMVGALGTARAAPGIRCRTRSATVRAYLGDSFAPAPGPCLAHGLSQTPAAAEPCRQRPPRGTGG